MPAPEQGDWEAIWLGVEDTALEDGWYPAEWDVKFNELSVFEKKVTFGPITRDSDDIISSYVMADWSGGGQVDLLTGADQTRYRHAILDADTPFGVTLPPLVQEIDPGGSGTTYPMLQIGDEPLVVQGTSVYVWDEDTDAFGASDTIASAPVGKGVKFGSRVFFPRGDDGYSYVTVSTSTPTVTDVTGVAIPTNNTDTTAPKAVDFEVWDNKLWALTTEGGLCWSFTGNSTEWDWTTMWGAFHAKQVRLDSATTPKRLVTYVDNNGDPCLWVITDRSAYRVDTVLQVYQPTSIQFSPHPDFARAVAVWRPGGDLHIGMGLARIVYTSAGVIDPESGLNRNDGMPYTNLGKITDFEGDASRLYTCVSGSDFGVTTTTLDAAVGSEGTGDSQFDDPLGVAVDSSGNVYVADSGNHCVKKFNSSLVYQSTIGSAGSGDGQLNSPNAVAVDASGNIFVSDPGNNRVQKFNSSGTYVTKLSLGSQTATGVAVDSSGNVYIATSGSQLWQTANNLTVTYAKVAFASQAHIATDASYLYIVSNNQVVKCAIPFTSNAQAVATTTWGTTGTGDGQFQAAIGIAVHPVSGNIFVSDTTRDDIQEFTSNGIFLRSHGAQGSGAGQFLAPTGIAFNAAGDAMYVADTGNDEVQKFLTSDVTREVPAVPTLMYWDGTGWHGVWELEGSPDEQLTWANITATTHATDGYRLWWGCSNGKVYSMPLRRSFHSPRAGWQSGYDRFAETGYILTSRFDALMTGFYKKARRLVVYTDNASLTETITVSYRIDVEDDQWIELGTVNSVGKTVLKFGEDGDGHVWGKRFNWIQFKFEFARGSDEYQTPVMSAAVLNYTKIPQQARTFMFTIPFPKKSWNGRSGKEIRDGLADLLAAEQYVKLVHQDTTYSGQLAAVAGITSLGQNTSGGAQVNFIEIRDDD